jgi:CheY-like chemotaxis protein/HPt (histidine-containing phosphotransfer) domain-containing protein
MLDLGLAKRATTTRFTLPSQKIATTSQLRIAAAGMTNTRVLLVEDNPLNQQVASEFLRNSGLKVVIAYNGQHALHSLENSEFDIVLMDIQMPVMDGLHATRLIRQQQRFNQLPIVAMSAGVTLSEQEQCKLAGMNDFIAKPIDPMQMLETIAKVLEIACPSLSIATDCGDETDFDLPGFDTERLRSLDKMLAGRGNVLHSIRLFVENFADIERELWDWLAKEDRSSACFRLHALKGVAKNLGASDVANLADIMECRLKEGGEIHAELKQFNTSWQLIVRTSQTFQNESNMDIEPSEPQAYSQNLETLRQLLTGHKLVPVDLLNSLAFGCSSEQIDTFNQLKKAVIAYDYDVALQILKALK